MVEAVVGPCFASSSQYDPRRLNHRTVVSGVSALGQTDFDSCQRHFRFTPNSGHSSVQLECPRTAKNRHGVHGLPVRYSTWPCHSY